MNQACNHFGVLSDRAPACFHLRTAGPGNGKSRSTDLFFLLPFISSRRPRSSQPARRSPPARRERNHMRNGAEDGESRFIVAEILSGFRFCIFGVICCSSFSRETWNNRLNPWKPFGGHWWKCQMFLQRICWLICADKLTQISGNLHSATNVCFPNAKIHTLFFPPFHVCKVTTFRFLVKQKYPRSIMW